ncbi:PAS domain S-box protein [Caldimonas brevitalea]|uniref:histidine kinase n=1 Tax=Caldimonas brevitalea TaxID=413882 RepID=A0A0G3BQ55_9BURK|nr:PAS domain S-box protein [Caldimonas brevitalea]AKJ29486.1 histidine kinase [Caldimonas brevitalea]
MSHHFPSLPGFDDRTVFRTLFSAYPDALLLVDAQGDIVLANPAACELLGYRADELLGLGVDVLVPDSIRPRHAAYRAAYGKAPRPRPMGTQTELVAKRRDGTEVMVEIALSPLQEHGLPYVVAAIRGIGDYPRVRQALQRARYSEHVAQFGRLAVDERDPQVLLAQVPRVAAEALQTEMAAVFLLEPNGLEFRVAGALAPLPGESAGDLIPNRPDTPAGYVLSFGRPVVVENYRDERRFVTPDAYLTAGLTSAAAVPLSDRGRSIGVLTVRSRAAQTFGDDELRFLESLSNLLATSLQRAQSEEALNHSQRLESVGQLTGGIAHDFNNLLTVISGNLQVLEQLPLVEQDDFAPQLVAAAMRATKRGAELTGKLLAFSRRQVLQPTQVDTGALIDSLADMLRRTLDQRIQIDVQIDTPAPVCLADPGQLESALLNIAINARDAMPDGGRLTFSCRSMLALPPALHGEVSEDETSVDGFVAIAITDTGSGMPEAVKEHAFEPFFTTKEAGRGTGLGLATVYGFAKQSRGAVSLDSTLGVGTTVTLYLPGLAEAGASHDLEVDAQGSVPPGLRVLLVEDDAEVRVVVHRFLVSLGCHVTACLNGEEALVALGPQAPFDLLLTDIALGAGMRGTELAREAQQRFPALRVLLMSGFASGLLATPPPWELLRKPYTRGELAAAIVRVMSEAAGPTAAP